MSKKKPETKEVENADLKLCLEHRQKIGCTISPLKIENVECDDYRFCSKDCPLPEEKRIVPPKKQQANNPLGVNLNVFEEVKPDKPKKEKISREIADFLDLQARVISRLAWKPEIWKALDNMCTNEILDRLLGKSTAETIPFKMGGRMDVTPSKETKKLFAKLEKQFADEDEKTGKKPYDFTEEPKGDWGGLGDCRDSAELGFFPKKEGEKKKNGKKPD